ncbi:SIMPL domain-containing protein [Pseudothauera hydrothermalis]|uniref:SIMPL domain-containing protein n=1 Tax=Pseudothauera hydrothermalis TaxID=2184083 RepID=UPI001F3465BC|nr:SIMPL domain-containing protein [Pseudothauera hydrothermalis]
MNAATRYLTVLLVCGALMAGQAHAQQAHSPHPITIDLNAEAQRTAPNDLALATAYIEITDANPAAVAREVNKVMTAALEAANRYEQIKTQSANTHTWPVYGKNGRQIEAWRMRSELRLESRDIAALSGLLGKLQTTMAVSQIDMQPAPETRRKALDEATVDAIRAFEQRASLMAAALGKPYRIRHLSVGAPGAHPQPMPRMRAALMAAEADAAPLQAGESEIAVTVSGTIELLD